MSGSIGQALNSRYAAARNDRYVCLRAKEEGGYSELVVYKMLWN